MATKSLRKIRHLRIRKKISGSSSKPRLSVFRTNKHIYAQLIDDSKSCTLASSSDLKITKDKKTSKIETAFKVGKDLAKMALEKKIKKVVFDRAGYKFHGRIKALAEGAKEGGSVF